MVLLPSPPSLSFSLPSLQLNNVESYLSSVSYNIVQVVHSLKAPSALPDRLLYKQTMETSALETKQNKIKKKDTRH